jgi:hypothetical protein
MTNKNYERISSQKRKIERISDCGYWGRIINRKNQKKNH